MTLKSTRVGMAI